MNYSHINKYLVREDAACEKDVYEQYLGDFGGEQLNFGGQQYHVDP